MSQASILRRLEKALRKRDKWAARVKTLRAALSLVAPESFAAPLISPQQKVLTFKHGRETDTDNRLSAAVLRDREAVLRRPNFSVIARSIGVTPSHVRRVYFGLCTSARTAKAIEAATSAQPAQAEAQAVKLG